MTGHLPEPPTTTLDAAVTTLAGNASAWVRIPLGAKLGYLRQVLRRFAEVSPDLVRDAVAEKGVDATYAGEDWVSGPLSVLRTSRFLATTLQGIDRTGAVPLPDDAIKERPHRQGAGDGMPGGRGGRNPSPPGR